MTIFVRILMLAALIVMTGQVDGQEQSPNASKGKLLPLELPPPPGTPRPRSPAPPPASEEQSFVYYPGIDFSGDDLAPRLADVSLFVCTDACRGHDGCKAFTFNTSKNGCFIKSGYGRPTRNAEAISAAAEGQGAILPELSNPVRLDIKLGIDYFGGDLRDLQLASLDECIVLCLAEELCVAFTYVPSRNWCSLKETLPEPRRRPGVTSGVKR